MISVVNSLDSLFLQYLTVFSLTIIRLNVVFQVVCNRLSSDSIICRHYRCVYILKDYVVAETLYSFGHHFAIFVLIAEKNVGFPAGFHA